MELTGATLDTPQSSNNPDYAEIGAGTGAVQAVEIWDTPGALVSTWPLFFCRASSLGVMRI